MLATAVANRPGQQLTLAAQPLTITTVDPDREMSVRNTVVLLERLWRKSGERLAARCRGLADEELLWEAPPAK